MPSPWQLSTALFVLALALMQAACVTINLPPGPGALEEHKVSGTGKDKVLLMDVSGVISSENKDGFYSSPGMLATVNEELERAAKDERVKAIVLRINSPGGTVTASDIIYHELKNFKTSRKLPIVASIMDVGASGVGDRLHAVVVDAADKGVEATHQVASGLVEGALGQVLNQGIEPLGGGEGELVLGDRGDGDPAARQRAQQVPQVEVGLLLHSGRDIAALAVELVDWDHPALGHVVGQRLAAGVRRLERKNPFFPLGGGLAGGRIDQGRVLGVAVVVLQQLHVNVIGSAGGGRVIGQSRAAHLFQMAVDVDHARGQGQDVGGRADLEAHDDGAFLEQDVGDLAPLQVDDVLLLVEFGIQQVAILMVTDALVILGRVECLA